MTLEGCFSGAGSTGSRGGRAASWSDSLGMDTSDRELMSRMARGDREALSPLMERHYARLYRVALSYLRDPDEALDAAQETFVKAYQNAHKWNASSEVAPWLTRVAVNSAIDRYRRRKRSSPRFPKSSGASTTPFAILA